MPFDVDRIKFEEDRNGFVVGRIIVKEDRIVSDVVRLSFELGRFGLDLEGFCNLQGRDCFGLFSGFLGLFGFFTGRIHVGNYTAKGKLGF